MNAAEHLRERAWKHPRDYGGFSPDGDYVIATQNRDSSALERSNWRRICADLNAEPYASVRPDAWHDDAGDDRPSVYHFRARHWACGWVEYLLVRADAPADVLTAAGEIVRALADYPVYDEDDYSTLEWTEAADYWARMSVRDRCDAIKRSGCRGVSLFAARREDLPSDDTGALLDYLRD
jgi:hypothetical protein